MATKSMAYDHPTYTTRQFASLKLPTVAASVIAGKFVAFTDIIIKKVNVSVDIAGTSTSGYDILTGTNVTVTSASTIFTLASAAGFLGTAYETDITLASGGYVAFRTNPSAATTLGASAMIEFEVVPGAAVEA